MTLYDFFIVFPDGETREIEHQLHPGDLIDMNGFPLRLPLPTNKMLAYHVARKRTIEERGTVTTLYNLEQLSANDLTEYL